MTGALRPASQKPPHALVNPGRKRRREIAGRLRPRPSRATQRRQCRLGRPGNRHSRSCRPLPRIDDLRQVSHALRRPVPLHAGADALRRLGKCFAYAFEGTPLYPAVIEAGASSGDMDLGEARIRFVDQPHGSITALGMRAEEGLHRSAMRLIFMSLLRKWQYVSGCRSVDLRLPARTPHPTHAHLDAVLGWARDLKVGQLLLTHLDESMDYATLAAELPDWEQSVQPSDLAPFVLLPDSSAVESDHRGPCCGYSSCMATMPAVRVP